MAYTQPIQQTVVYSQQPTLHAVTQPAKKESLSGSEDLDKVATSEADGIPVAEFWETPKVLVFKIGLKLYSVDITRLATHSTFFRDLINLPSDTSKKNDEGTKQNPIVIRGLKNDEFEAFLRWNNHCPWDAVSNSMTREHFMSILKLGDMWSIRPAMLFAIENLEKIKLSVAEHAGLAVRYGIIPWLAPAAKRLLSELGETRDYDMYIMGSSVFYCYHAAKIKLEKERRLLALCIPELDLNEGPEGTYCPHHQRCLNSLEDTWCKVIIPALIHPIKPVKLDDAADFVEKTIFHRMQPACKALLMERIRKHNGFQRGVERIERELVQDLKASIYHEHIVEEEPVEEEPVVEDIFGNGYDSGSEDDVALLLG